MRLTALLSILALLTAALALPAGQLCLPAPTGVASSSSCCAGGQCECSHHCACAFAPPAESSQPTTLAPTASTSLSLLAATLVARVPASLDADDTHNLPRADEGPAPLAGHVRSLTSRAPPCRSSTLPS